MISYFLVLLSLSFLFLKDEKLSHPFVRQHVKMAFALHLLLFWVLYIMSYPFFEWIQYFSISLNSVITSFLLLCIFITILYCMLRAHNGKSAYFSDIFHSTGIKETFLQNHSTEISEKDAATLILGHIPFIGYILYGREKKSPHMRDIVMLNFIVTFFIILFSVFGYYSLSSVIFLFYTIYSVFSSTRLIWSGEISTPNLDMIPWAEEKYILQKSIFTYIKQSLKKSEFKSFSEIKELHTLARYEQEKANLEMLTKLPISKIPSYIFYIPFLNLIGIFLLSTREKFHIKNGLILTLIAFLLLAIFWKNSEVLLLLLFPIFYGIWYTNRKAYKMPYIYDIYQVFENIWYFLSWFFIRTKKLKNTHIQETVKIWNNKNES